MDNTEPHSGGVGCGRLPGEGNDQALIGFDASRADALWMAAGEVCSIEPSSYDRTCSVASDCVTQAGPFPVQFGDFCQPNTCWCGGSAINRDSVSQYVHDVSMTPWGTDAITPPICSCPMFGAPCCVSGQCTVDCPSDAGG
jgi:hypothetical protein